MMRIALFLNLAASLVSAAWAVVALVRPASLSGSAHISDGEIFYARMYAARSIPLGLATAILPFYAPGKAVAWLLFTAAMIQIADALIATQKHERGMMLGASLGALVHLLCGLAFM